MLINLSRIWCLGKIINGLKEVQTIEEKRTLI